MWAKSGSELFFMDGTRGLISAQIDPASGQVLDRQTLFTIPDEYFINEASYEPHSDGERFLMVRSDGIDMRDAFVVVQNWFTELRERMGGN